MIAGRSLLIAAVLVVAAHPVLPAFGDVPAADEAFKSGRELFKAGRFAESCVQFERSQALDPALGTLFNIAQCDERIGKLATALAAYREVVSKDTNQARRQTASDNAGNLEGRVAKLLVQVPSSMTDVSVKLAPAGGTARTVEANKPLELDMGEYTVDIRAEGMAAFTAKTKLVDEGKTVVIRAKLVPGKAAAAVQPEPAADKPSKAEDTDRPPPHSQRKLIAVATMATGGAVVVTGMIFGGLASSKWGDAKAVCGGQTCTSQADADRASALGDQARSKANVATALFVVGGLAAAAGVVLWVTAPEEHAVAVTAHASAEGGAVMLSGRF